jgi:hypothetical protein
MRETVKSSNAAGQDDQECAVIPYVPGSSDPMAEDFWDQPETHRVRYRVTSGQVGREGACEPGRRPCPRAARSSPRG